MLSLLFLLGVNASAATGQSVLDGISVHGGDVLRVHGNEGTVLQADPGGRIAGVVFDSLRVGLAGARVYVEGLASEAASSGEPLWDLAELQGATLVIPSEAPVRTLDLRVESN